MFSVLLSLTLAFFLLLDSTFIPAWHRELLPWGEDVCGWWDRGEESPGLKHSSQTRLRLCTVSDTCSVRCEPAGKWGLSTHLVCLLCIPTHTIVFWAYFKWEKSLWHANWVCWACVTPSREVRKFVVIFNKLNVQWWNSKAKLRNKTRLDTTAWKYTCEQHMSMSNIPVCVSSWDWANKMF